MLERWVSRAAERATEREVAVQHPWRARSLGLPANETDADRRQTGGSNTWASALTVRVQNGQTGVSKTTSTPSSINSLAAAGPVSSRIVVKL